MAQQKLEDKNPTQLRVGLTLTLKLSFDEDDGDWTIETRLTTTDGYDEVSSVSPCTSRLPTVEDCREELCDKLDEFAESVNSEDHQ